MNARHDRTDSLKPSQKRSRAPLFLFWIASLLAGPAAHASVLCVATLNGGLDAHDYGLVAAFSAANSGPEGGTWDIRLRYGTYQLTGDLKFDPDGSHDNKTFYLSGGWDATCTNRTGHASNTIVRGKAPSPAYSTAIEFNGDNARYDIEYVRFENFTHFFVNDPYCPVLVLCPDTDTVYVERNEFSNGGWISVTTYDASHVVFRNNLVTKLNSYDSGYANTSAVEFTIPSNQDPPQITFNTFADITCKAGDEGAISLFSSQSQLALNHNVVQTSDCTNDIHVDTNSFGIDFVNQWTGGTLTPYYNLFATIGGGFDGDLLGNGNVISTNVKFVDAANGNYRLQNTSPAANAGATLIGAIQSGILFSPIDLDGKVRPVAAHFDIGAYESNTFDSTPPVITVNSTNDVDDDTCDATHCSLREAINLANVQTGSAQRIVFDVPGSCPSVIFLNSELPDITDPLTIDGYTQPGANENSLDFGSDANVCITITAGAAGVAHAFAVASGQPDTTQLVIRGLSFGSGFYAFGTDAIDLRAGSGHRIIGNVFGGYMPPAHNAVSVGSLPRAILGRGTAKNVKIGTPAAADRNYFGNLVENGIVLNDATSTGHRIENNYIGVQPDGLTAQANQNDGISASGGSNVTINGNTIDASFYGISLLGATTTKFTVTRNNIGVNALGIGNATLSNNVGIAVGIGSGQHVIGAKATDNLQPGKYSNFIDNNAGDGILLAADAGSANSIRGNAIGNNGRSGTGIGIDLGGSQSQLANDAGDGDGGPNALQNYPMIKGSSPIDANTRKVNAQFNTSANQAVRVDFYQSLSCGGGKGADATNFVGSAETNSGASGSVKIAATIVEAGKSGFLTATATTSSGQTSELAPCVPEDRIFADGTE